ncbi:MAG TPA: glycosyltransferase family 39 protein [Candidatus Eisenbacteria bacterium]|nr:glycosyltransferase family 39 protein [Candidatus Eisenbacteria bacterium]
MSRRALSIAWGLPALVLLVTCGWLGLFEPTETRYAEIAREMLRSGDWIVPRLNDIAHFHKPPVAYWGAALGMAIFGVNEWGARFFNALAAGFTLWAAVRIGRRLENDATAALAAVVLASMALFAALARQLASDLPLTACSAWFWVSYLDSRDRGPDARPSVLPFVAMAVGFMAKGPIIFLHTMLPLLGVSFLARGSHAWRPLRSGRGWALFALVALPWYLLVVFTTKGLLGYLLGDQVWARYATTAHQRSGPWYYFAAILIAGALPWTGAAFVEFADRARRLRAGFRDVPFDSALLLSWAVLPAVFFSTAGSKLPAYVLPETIPVALLVGCALVRAPRLSGWSAAIPLAALAVGLEWFGPGALAKAVGATHAARLDLSPAAHAAAALWLLAAAALAAGRVRAGAWGVWAGFVAILFAVAPLEGPLGSPRPLAALVARARGPEEPLVEYEEFNAGLPFYLETRALLVEVPRDLRFEEQGHRAVVRHAADVGRLAREHGRVWILAKRGKALKLAEDLDLVAEPVAAWRGREMTILRPME